MIQYLRENRLEVNAIIIIGDGSDMKRHIMCQGNNFVIVGKRGGVHIIFFLKLGKKFFICNKKDLVQ
jgi:hypothetical protein